MSNAPPFLYSAEQRNDSRFPGTAFDPKAVTRASWEPKVRRPQPTGPLISLNRHPDLHVGLPSRSANVSPLNPRTKKWIKWLRRVQLGLRLLELNAAIGILTLLVLLTKMETAMGWIMRISPGFSALHCLYAIYHLSRGASGRTPATSSAYQLFAVFLDLAIMSLYGFGAFSVQTTADTWGTRLSDQSLVDIFVPAAYYTLVGAGSLHVVSLFLSMWLGWTFRKISLMPPDMNPLEDHLTARPFHKRNKSSMTTASYAESEKRLSTPLEARNRSGLPYQDASRPPTVPFMHTRTQSRDSFQSRDSRTNLPSRQYQVVANNSPRTSVCAPTSARGSPRSWNRGSYAELPLNDPVLRQHSAAPESGSQGRVAKFTENWVPTDSLISRTNQKGQPLSPAKNGTPIHGSKPYSALNQRYNLDDSSDSEYGDENIMANSDGETELDLANAGHPNPLGSNPAASPRLASTWTKTPLRPWSNSKLAAYSPLSELNTNERLAGDSRDVADEVPALKNVEQRPRGNSIQSEDAFYSWSYGDVKCATPPVVVGQNRKVSSGNDYSARFSSVAYGRRKISGKAAEEGRAGGTSSERSMAARGPL